MCSADIKEVTSHYLQNQRGVYACMLDATKAFDKVSFTKLFALLLKRIFQLSCYWSFWTYTQDRVWLHP